MRISLLVGTTVYPLAGEAGVSERVHSSAGDLRVTPVAQRQTLLRVRAAHAVELDRGNLATTITFTTSRLFASAAECFLYALDYDAAVPREGILVLEAIGASGGTTTRHLLAAVVDPPARQCVGCTLLLTYSATGGEIVAGASSVVGTQADIQISGATGGSVGVNGAVTAAPDYNGKMAWSTSGGPIDAANPPSGEVIVWWYNGSWNVATMDNSGTFTKASTAADPTGGGWTAVVGTGNLLIQWLG